ncbi:MAG: S8 family serine peptidase [Bdellovibrionota bacterium]
MADIVLRQIRLLILLGTLIATSVGFAQSSLPPANVVPGEYIVKFKGQPSTAKVQGKLSGKVNFKGRAPMAGMYHVQLKGGVSAKDLSDDPDVEYVEPNYILTKADDVPPGEPIETFSADDVAALSSVTYYQNFAPTQLEQAWQVKKAFNAANPQNRPIVAIVDTGFNKNHSVVTATNAMWRNTAEIAANGVDDDGNGYVDDINGWNFINNTANFADDQGHGTHVGGIVLGVGLDILSSSLDPAIVQLMPLKFLDSAGSGSTSNAIRAIYYAVNNGAKVINCSWGGGSYSRALQDALSFAYQNEVLVVSAAGNAAANNDSTAMYPANYDVPSNISVGASTDSDVLAYFSNYGVTSVHMAAPGYQIYSLYGNGYATMSGTSMAAPFVAGLAAMGIREQPTIKAYQLKQTLLDNVDVLGSLSSKVKGSGRANVLKFINTLRGGGFVVSSSQPTYVAVYKAEGGSTVGSASGGGGGCGMIQDVADKLPPGFSGLVGILLLAPLAWAAFMRNRAPESRRKFDRFRMESSVTIQCGDQTIVGNMKTISMGGVSFDAKQALEKGGQVTMRIENPGGGEPIEVAGHIVWSSKDQSYGVQFSQVESGIQNTINKWTQKLSKAA